MEINRVLSVLYLWNDDDESKGVLLTFWIIHSGNWTVNAFLTSSTALGSRCSRTIPGGVVNSVVPGVSSVGLKFPSSS